MMTLLIQFMTLSNSPVEISKIDNNNINNKTCIQEFKYQTKV